MPEQSISIVEEIKKSYLEYAMSVIVDRALPQINDGLKPIHRRILYTLYHGKIFNFVKSARIVGDCMSQFHPHGDSSIYSAMVNMTDKYGVQLYPAVDGQGNFGSWKYSDGPAAYRYTEARLNDFGKYLFRFIDEDTTDWIPNYDGTCLEPKYIPTFVPLVLINWIAGVAVGMASKMPPHNLKEICEACIALIENPKLELKDILKIINGPDFSSGGIITNKSELHDVYTGKTSRINIRGKYEIEDKNIIITELPFGKSIEDIMATTAKMVNDGVLREISDIRDESAADIRVVIVMKRGVDPNKVYMKILKKIGIVSSFSANFCMVDDRDILENMPLIDILRNHIRFCQRILVRSCNFKIKKNEERSNLLKGMLIAYKNIDKVIALVKSSESKEGFVQEMITKLSMNKIQAEHIWDMQLNSISKIRISNIMEEYKQIQQKISSLQEILSNEKKFKETMKAEFQEIIEKFGIKRKTKITNEAEKIVEEVEKQIEESENKASEVYVSQQNYVATSMTALPDGDVWEKKLSVKLSESLVVISNDGRAFGIKIPDLTRNARFSGAFVNLSKEQVVGVTSANSTVLLITKSGLLKKMKLDNFNPRQAGQRFYKKVDDVILCKECSGSGGFVLANSGGFLMAFDLKMVNESSIGSGFIKGMNMQGKYQVVSADNFLNENIVIYFKNKEVKRMTASDLRLKGRTWKGIPLGEITWVSSCKKVVIDGKETKIEDIPSTSKHRHSKISASSAIPLFF